MLVDKNGEVDFEWPQQSEFKAICQQEKVKLKMLEIWKNHEGTRMGGIRITLTNGAQSPYFKANCTQLDPKTFQVLDSSTPRKLKLYGGGYSLSRLIIEDE